MAKVYDVFKDEYIDESEMELIAPPERYIRVDPEDRIEAIIDAVMDEYRQNYPELQFEVAKDRVKTEMYKAQYYSITVKGNTPFGLNKHIRYYISRDEFSFLVDPEDMVRSILDKLVWEIG